MAGSRRRVTLVAAVATLVATIAAVVALAATGHEEPEGRLTPEQAEGLRQRIIAARDVLEREGIYLDEGAAAPDATCARVALLNPTAANLAYVERRFGPGVCVAREPGEAPACQSAFRTPPIPEGGTVVPDLVGVRYLDAQRRAAAIGLPWSACDGPARDEPSPPPRFSVLRLASVTDQCPRPGQRVPRGTPIVLTLGAVLPGDYRFEGGAPIRRCLGGRRAAVN